MAIKKKSVASADATAPTAEEKPVIEHASQNEVQTEETPAAETTASEPEPEGEAPPFEADAEQIAADEDEAKAKAVLAGEAAKEKTEPPKLASTSLAKSAGVGAIAKADGTTSQKAMAQLAEDGFEDVDVSGFGVFPILKLEDGTFLDTDERDFGKEFTCVIMQRNKKWVYKNTKCAKKEETVIYSYDQKTVSGDSGQTLEEVFAEWAEEGWGWEEKPYLECPAVIRGGEFDGEMVLLSISPTSIKKFDGHAYTNQMRYGLSPARYVTKCKVGRKVTSTQHDFYPWSFSYSGPLEVEVEAE